VHDETAAEMGSKKVCTTGVVHVAVGKNYRCDLCRIKTKRFNIPDYALKAFPGTAVDEDKFVNIEEVYNPILNIAYGRTPYLVYFICYLYWSSFPILNSLNLLSAALRGIKPAATIHHSLLSNLSSYL